LPKTDKHALTMCQFLEEARHFKADLSRSYNQRS